ncbi:hypothetical protein HGA91_00275 [candidate division WWE3 bacterium]|nr:hypothetical protein [candidate division WWE3 bacterium]
MKRCFACSGKSPVDAQYCINCSAPYPIASTGTTKHLGKQDDLARTIAVTHIAAMMGLIQFTMIIIGDMLMYNIIGLEYWKSLSLFEFSLLWTCRGMLDTGISLLVLIGLLRLTTKMVITGSPRQIAKKRIIVTAILALVMSVVGLMVAPELNYNLQDKTTILAISLIMAGAVGTLIGRASKTA